MSPDVQPATVTIAARMMIKECCVEWSCEINRKKNIAMISRAMTEQRAADWAFENFDCLKWKSFCRSFATKTWMPTKALKWGRQSIVSIVIGELIETFLIQNRRNFPSKHSAVVAKFWRALNWRHCLFTNRNKITLLSVSFVVSSIPQTHITALRFYIVQSDIEARWVKFDLSFWNFFFIAGWREKKIA